MSEKEFRPTPEAEQKESLFPVSREHAEETDRSFRAKRISTYHRGISDLASLNVNLVNDTVHGKERGAESFEAGAIITFIFINEHAHKAQQQLPAITDEHTRIPNTDAEKKEAKKAFAESGLASYICDLAEERPSATNAFLDGAEYMVGIFKKAEQTERTNNEVKQLDALLAEDEKNLLEELWNFSSEN